VLVVMSGKYCRTPCVWGIRDIAEQRRDIVGTPSIRRGVIQMAKVSPFHSKLPGTEVYHDNNACAEGNNIESPNRVSGTGGLKKCSTCKD